MFEIKKATKCFGSQRVLDDLSLSLAEGTVTGLLGPNGAGKTTLMRCVLGILRLDAGEILFDGVNIYAHPEVKQRIGYIADRPLNYADYSMEDMTRFFRLTYKTWDEDRFRSLMDMFAFPKKQKMRTLSRGVNLLTAFVLNLSFFPKLLLLDEPLSGLDPIIRQTVLRLILGQVAEHGTRVLLSSHNTGDLERICDNVTFLKDGKVIFSDSLETLKRNTIKLQAVFSGELPAAVKESPSLLSVTRLGTAYTFVGKRDLLTICQHNGADTVQEIEITLEEIYIHYMGGVKNEKSA